MRFDSLRQGFDSSHFLFFLHLVEAYTNDCIPSLKRNIAINVY